jgi:hypothetical protein
MLYTTSEYASRKTCLQQDPAAQTLTCLDLQILRMLHSLRTTTFTYKHTTRINEKKSSNITNITKQKHKTNLRFRDDRMDIKNTKNGAKTIKICTNKGTRTYL